MKLSPRHYGIIISGLITAYLHISLYPDFGHLDWIVLNGFGTIALLGAYFLPIPYFQKKHLTVFWSLAGYIAFTIFLWLIFGDKTFQLATTAAIGYYAKTAEFILLAFLWADLPKAK
ncbi:MAG: hypothetical protein ABI904_22030 [Chloroflexota bacterium]